MGQGSVAVSSYRTSIRILASGNTGQIDFYAAPSRGKLVSWLLSARRGMSSSPKHGRNAGDTLRRFRRRRRCADRAGRRRPLAGQLSAARVSRACLFTRSHASQASLAASVFACGAARAAASRARQPRGSRRAKAQIPGRAGPSRRYPKARCQTLRLDRTALDAVRR